LAENQRKEEEQVKRMDIQLRSEETGIDTANTLGMALMSAKANPSIWKISFQIESGERVRLVRNNSNEWVLEMMDMVLGDPEK